MTEVFRGESGERGLAQRLQADDETLEPLLAGEGLILQKRHGYRFSLDALVLADFAIRFHGASARRRQTRYIDLGTGCGVILILLARSKPDLAGYGIEIQESLAEVARKNLAIHRLEDRFEILCMDLKDLTGRFPPASFDWITTNPPYRRVWSGRVNPDPQKALARHELAASLWDICLVAGYLLRERGRMFLIHSAIRMAELLVHLREGGLEAKTVRPVYPKPGAVASWVLVEAVRKGKVGLSLEQPLFVEDGKGRYTEEMERIFRWRR